MRRWAFLGSRCEYDVSLVQADVWHEAAECRNPWLAEAWLMIAEAMTRYLAWKGERTHL
jgi:hypothetical protein